MLEMHMATNKDAQHVLTERFHTLKHAAVVVALEKNPGFAQYATEADKYTFKSEKYCSMSV